MRPCVLTPLLNTCVDFDWLSLWKILCLAILSVIWTLSASLHLSSLLLKATARSPGATWSLHPLLCCCCDKCHDLKQLKAERFYFCVWFQIESIIAGERHGSRKRKLRAHILNHKHKAEKSKLEMTKGFSSPSFP